jgi:hypothetical protein
MNLVLEDKKDHHKGVLALFGYPNFSRSLIIALGFAALTGVLLVGCGGDQPRGDRDTQFYADESSAVFAPEPVQTPDPALDLDDEDTLLARDNIGGWSILLMKVEQGGMVLAQQMLDVIQTEGGLIQARIEQRDSGLVIVYGDYLDKSDPRAIKDFKRVLKTQIGGQIVFENAIFLPPSSEALRGSNPSYDLRTVKGRLGDLAIYTLQVGLYGRGDFQTPSAQDLAAFRRAAEDAVRELRSQGEMAFYYHAPARSMVTIGVFGERDYDASTMPPTQSPALRSLREKFPNNLLNGQGINETIRTESGKMTRIQSSQLVAIPER